MSNSKPLVLLVEDEPSLINLYQEILKNEHRVIVAQNFEIANNILAKQQPDIILLDLLIPVKAGHHLDYSQRVGFNLLKQIKANKLWRNIPVLILTNLDSPEDRKKAKKLKAVDFVVKANILPAQLVKKISEILKSK